MGIFNSTYMSDGISAVACEGYDAEFNSELDIALESCDDSIAIMEAIYMYDIAETSIMKKVKEGVLTESAAYSEAETVLEGKMGNIWATIKTKINALWEKIKAFFKTLTTFIAGVFMDAESFVKKYETQLTSLKLNGFKYSMYTYTHTSDDVSNIISTVSSLMNEGIQKVENKVKTLSNSKGQLTESKENEMKETKENFEDNFNDTADKCRGELVGKTSVPASDYADELFRYFRNGSGNKKMKDDVAVNISTIISDIKKIAPQKSNITKAEARIDQIFKDTLNTIKTLENDAQKATVADGGNSEGFSKKQSFVVWFAQASTKTVQMTASITLSFLSAWKTAVKEQLTTYKSVCLKALTYKEK
jgi:phage-related protein